MVRDVHHHGAGKWTIKKFYSIPENHPDRVCGHTTYTHILVIRYKPTNRDGTWECVYGVAEGGDIHLWMD